MHFITDDARGILSRFCDFRYIRRGPPPAALGSAWLVRIDGTIGDVTGAIVPMVFNAECKVVARPCGVGKAYPLLGERRRAQEVLSRRCVEGKPGVSAYAAAGVAVDRVFWALAFCHHATPVLVMAPR